jgi:hypothetical protein
MIMHAGKKLQGEHLYPCLHFFFKCPLNQAIASPCSAENVNQTSEMLRLDISKVSENTVHTTCGIHHSWRTTA